MVKLIATSLLLVLVPLHVFATEQSGGLLRGQWDPGDQASLLRRADAVERSPDAAFGVVEWGLPHRTATEAPAAAPAGARQGAAPVWQARGILDTPFANANQATIVISANYAEGTIEQSGYGNRAWLGVDGDHAVGRLRQLGVGNYSKLLVEGDASDGELTVIGSRNAIELTVTNTRLSYRLHANDVSGKAAVASNTRSIRIEQYSR